MDHSTFWPWTRTIADTQEDEERHRVGQFPGRRLCAKLWKGPGGGRGQGNEERGKRGCWWLEGGREGW